MRPILPAVLLLVAACGTRPIADGLRSPVDCSGCHGDAESPAPPRGVKWENAPASVEVGAHRLHLRDTPIRSAVACADCHVVPATVDAPGHVDGPRATVTFSPLATHEGSLTPRWDRDEESCSLVYCHGATLAGGSAPAPRWTFLVEPDPARPAAEICGTCHAARPALPHPQLGPCFACHPATVRADGAIDTAGGKHIDGSVQEAAAAAPCGACHPIPGDGGAHAAHYADLSPVPLATYGDTRTFADYGATGGGYLFGCGNCHPLDEAKHMDGALEVELGGAGAPAGSLKARNAPGAALGDDGTCSGVYCHSSGQEAPSFAATPAWASGATLACDGCHGNPPRYPSGPAGSATANTHLQSRSSTSMGITYTGGWGHFAWHNRTRTVYTQNRYGQHGVTSPPPANPEEEVADGTFGAAPMTCQACHYETVDPAATGPSGYWWLNTTGRYDVPGQSYAAYDCTTSTCHDDQPGAFAPIGSGGVLPQRHVNGARDVVFDPRTAPSTYGTPPEPAAPLYPYWVELNAFRDGLYLPEGAAIAPPPPADGSAGPGTVSFRLDIAGWDPATRTCSSVACHLRQASVQWGGTGLGTYSTCFNCHTSH